MKLLVKAICLCSLLIPTAGCWDQNFLKQQSLAFSVGYDTMGHSKSGLQSISIVRTLKPVGSGQTQPFNNSYEVKGETPLDVRESMNVVTPGTYSTNKLRVLVIGQELAKKDIYPLLDLYFREARSNINTKVIVSEGKAKDFLQSEYIQGNLITDAISELLISAEKESLIPKLTMGTLMPIMFNPGQDIILPYMGTEKGKKSLKVKGVTLFNKRKNMGKHLLGEKASLLLLMMDKAGKTAQFTVDSEDSEESINKKITIVVANSKPKITLNWKSGKPVYRVNLKLDVSVSEYTKGMLSDSERKRLNKLLSKRMTAMAKKVTKTLNETNCDAFGLGQMMMIQNPDKFKGYEWDQDFKDITIIPQVKVNIISNGILY